MFSEVDLWPLGYRIPSLHHFSHLWHFFLVNALTTGFCDVTVTFDLRILTNSSSTPSWHLCPNWDEIPEKTDVCVDIPLPMSAAAVRPKRPDFLLSSSAEFSVTLCSALLAVTESWTVTMQEIKTHCAVCDGGLLTGGIHWSEVERNTRCCYYLDFSLVYRWIIC